MGGDFNEAPDSYDRFFPRYGNITSNKIINDLCSNLSLVDVYRFLHDDISSFTWLQTGT